jgi:1,4-alpha-glucan branching enzyme
MSHARANPGFLSLILHAHLPFVRHPEHEFSLEETWLFEAISECYLPLLQRIEAWQKDGIQAPLTLTLSPTLCSMLRDPLLRSRYVRHLESLIELVEKEAFRTRWEPPFHQVALFYGEHLRSIRDTYSRWGGDLIAAFRAFQERGRLEIITSAATHALLPLLAGHPPSVRAQLRVACDHYRSCFGCDPRGIWLPECAYSGELETHLIDAGLRWFVLDAHGLLHARPRPRSSVFAPILTPGGLAVFGRDLESAKQVWSRQEGYPGDPYYREFYRDIGFDLELDYLRPYLPAGEHRGFTGIKYYRITGSSNDKAAYDRKAALDTALRHANHFFDARAKQFERLRNSLEVPPLIVSPYDAELFGHWWYEGPEFLDAFVRKTAAAGQSAFTLATPSEYLRRYLVHQVAEPCPSSWGEEGCWGVWLNEANEWIVPHLQVAQERMTGLVRRALNEPGSNTLRDRALKQAARELLLAQSSDWPFILRTGTSPEYARKRVTTHLLHFTKIYDQLTSGNVDDAQLAELEATDNLFPDVDYRYWA